jgi:type II secretory pathway component GspD/PulD (secretin)
MNSPFIRILVFSVTIALTGLQAQQIAPVPALPQVSPAPTVIQALPGGTGSSGLPVLKSDQGYYVENAPINEVFQYLTRLLGKQYFFNNELTDPKFNISGQLMLSDHLTQMDELALAFGLAVYQQGSTVYLMNEEQLAKLPVEVLTYQLRYLRGSGSKSSASVAPGMDSEGGGGGGAQPAEFEKLKSIIKPMLTREVGIIEFEEKTNTLLITDNSVKLQRVQKLLEKIDRPKQQIAINVRILRVRKNNGRKVGVDWSSVLGDGLPISIAQSLNAAFNLPDANSLVKSFNTASNSASSFSQIVDTLDGTRTTTEKNTRTGDESVSNRSTLLRSYTEGSGLTFDPLQVTAIIHALEQQNLITQEACPTVITEDNEQGLITIVDRFPIILSQQTNTTSGTNVTDQVRYKVDDQDPDPMREPELSREIGVTLSVTPTLLPDGTVRMRLRPRVANVVEFITGESGNIFPRVSESTVEGISRVPAGQSLFLGGFYDSKDGRDEQKVPILGSIPLIRNLFRYKNNGTEQVSLVFIITPTIYDAGNADELPSLNSDMMWNSGFNRTNATGPVTPLLPNIVPGMPGYFPNPMDRPSHTPPAGFESEPTRKRTWLGRIFSRKPAPLPGSIQPAVSPAPTRTFPDR